MGLSFLEEEDKRSEPSLSLPCKDKEKQVICKPRKGPTPEPYHISTQSQTPHLEKHECLLLKPLIL